MLLRPKGKSPWANEGVPFVEIVLTLLEGKT
jgi:hypothetical protein